MSLKSYAEEVAFTHEMSQVTLRLMELTFEQAAREYRRVETEFVARAGNDEDDVRDIQRRITAQILGAAHDDEQPHEVCRGIWEELVERGFSDREQKRIFTGIYARCCQWNGEFDAGIAVLEPLIAESEAWLEHAALTPELRAYWEHDLTMARKIRDELEAGIRQLLMPMDRKLTPREIALTQRVNAVQFRECNGELTFEQAVREYRQIEAEFVECADDDEETKRRITESILDSACKSDQPHEVCREIWEELVQRGFSNEERRHSMSMTYARCCQSNGEFDAGLAVIDPLINDLESSLDDTMLTPKMRHFCGSTLQLHRMLRDELKAGIRK
ncbi:MAG: hypothetical protein IPM54_08970 [Polyangiaceae bacterium]|nr:hypothetical protein [Polyangiaceae bacterium]